MKILKLIIIPFVVLTLTVFLSFYHNEDGDEGSVILGTIVYLPYVFLLTWINFAIIIIGQQYLFKIRFKYLTALLTTIVLTIIYLASAGNFKIHYWPLSIYEFVILNLVIIILNSFGLFIWSKPKVS